MIDRNGSLLVAGGRGMLGSAILRRLREEGFDNLLAPTSDQLDLRDPLAVQDWFAENRPKYVIHVAGTVGGLGDNIARPAVFWYDNMLMAATVLEAAHRHGVDKLLYLGSSCIYPKDCPQPMSEDALLTGPLEPTNDAYAVTKIAGAIGCQAYRRQHGDNFISALPCNLYGPGDHFEPERSHVVAALVRKFHEAKEAGQQRVTIWGTGTPRRELMYVDDAADACLCLMDKYDESSPVNIGLGQDLTIKQLAEEVREVIYPQAKLDFDLSRPDGVAQKLLDTGRLNRLGWQSRTDLRSGLEKTYAWFVQHATQPA